jgi:hypothetical protein
LVPHIMRTHEELDELVDEVRGVGFRTYPCSMATNKTMPTKVSVDDYVAGLPSDRRRAEAVTLRTLFEEASGKPAVMWGPSIVGFGQYHYKYESGREGDAAVAGFSARKGAISLYGIYNSYGESIESLQADLGAVTAGVGCVYVKRLTDIDLDALQARVRAAFED